MVTVSQKEFQRVKVIENAVDGRLSVGEAAGLLQLSERQVQRLKRRYRPNSVAWVHHGNRGRPMPWALPAVLRRTILELARGKYRGFNDSHLARNFTAKRTCRLAGRAYAAFCAASWLLRRSVVLAVSRPPLAPSRFGMMVFTDASRHDWLEGRGPELTLVGLQDDATSQILSAHFQLEEENTLGYFRALHAMVSRARRGRSASIATATASSSATIPTGPWPNNWLEKQSPTQLGRALEELGIQQIPAYSPQAKGRIERAWRTCQDRLVSELRLAQACDLVSANQVLARFCADYNQRFAVPARQSARRLPFPPPALRSRPLPQLPLSARGRPDHVITFGAHSIALPALPSKRGYPGATGELSHRLDAILLVSYRKQLLLSFAFAVAVAGSCQIAALLLASPAENKENRCPASTTSAADPP